MLAAPVMFLRLIWNDRKESRNDRDTGKPKQPESWNDRKAGTTESWIGPSAAQIYWWNLVN
jgi:hypothetical protein